jgi:MFS family permease
MNEPLQPSSLHPSSLGEILDRTAQLYRSRFFVFLGISVVPTVVVLVPFCGFFLLLAWLGSNSTSPPAEDWAKTFAVVFLVIVSLIALAIYAAIAALAMAAMNHAVSRAYLGERITIRDAYKAAWSRGWHYIGLLILEGIIVAAAPMAAWVVLVFLAAGAGVLAQRAGMGGDVNDAMVGLAAVLAIVALLCYCVWMLLRLSLAFPASVIEQIGAWSALKRSSALTKGTKGRIFLLYLLGAALTWLLSLGITIPLAIVMALVSASVGPQRAQALNLVMAFVIYGASFAIQALTRPIYGIALTLFYYDQRIRQEGFDIEWLMQRAGLTAPPPPQHQAAPWLSPIPLQPSPDPEPPHPVEIQQSTQQPPPIFGESQ